MTVDDEWEGKSKAFRTKGDELVAEEKWDDAIVQYTKVGSVLYVYTERLCALTSIIEMSRSWHNSVLSSFIPDIILLINWSPEWCALYSAKPSTCSLRVWSRHLRLLRTCRTY